MPREANIPLFLWIATAVVAHGIWGGGADHAARLIGETLEIREFAASVRRVAQGKARPVEVTLLDDESLEEEEPDPQAEPEELEREQDPAKNEDSTEDDPDERKSEPDPDAPEHEQKPEDKPEEKKPEEQKKEEEKPKNELALEKLPPAEQMKRIAVRQHVQDPNQEDNPDAEFIADQANRVKEQTQARITSTDQNDPKPNPGTSAASGPPDQAGNGELDRVAQSEDREGDPNRAPQERGQTEQRPRPAEAKGPNEERSAALSGVARRQDGAAQGSQRSERVSPLPGQAGQRAQQASREQEAMPETLTGEQGRFGIQGPREASIEQKGRRAKKKRELPKPKSGNPGDILGLGAPGMTPGGINLNLTPGSAVGAIGQDRLSRERLADGQRRRSAHRGTWKTGGIERWRSAIENYVPGVKPGNQTALNAARVPFASYLNGVHNRLHPVFADSFLSSLDELPGSHPMNQPQLVTHLEIVLDQDEGRIKRMGVTRTSGVTAFDIAALESVHRAQPFGAPPREIVSPDGNVYFHWEFYRNPMYACSTYFAHPFILKGTPKPAPPGAPPAKEPPVQEYEPPPAGERHGEAPHDHVHEPG